MPYAVLFFCIFYLFYGTASYISSLRSDINNVGFDWEVNIPFIPEMSLIYLSSSLLLIILIFAIDTKKEIKLIANILIVETIIASIIYLIYPVTNNFSERIVTGWVSIPFSLADTVNLSYNEVPSLHVALACTAAYFLSVNKTIYSIIFFRGWALLIATSTLLIHEHHIIDIIAGYLLSLFVISFFLRKSQT